MTVSYCDAGRHHTLTILSIRLPSLSNHPHDIFTYNQPDYQPQTNQSPVLLLFSRVSEVGSPSLSGANEERAALYMTACVMGSRTIKRGSAGPESARHRGSPLV
jgi:hypothetical protein